MVPRLIESKIMTALDADALRLYCQAAVRYEQANKAVRKHGIVVKNRFGHPMLSPFWQAAQQEARTMQQLLSHFGMTPAGRTRVREATRRRGRTSGKSTELSVCVAFEHAEPVRGLACSGAPGTAARAVGP